MSREAMKMALTALENVNCDSIYEQSCSVCNVIEALRTALAQPEPEPVTILFGSLPVYDVPPAEPVAYLTKRKLSGTEGLLRADMVDMSAKNKETHDFIPLYTAPPQRKPLTDEQIIKCYETTGHCQILRLQDKFAVFALSRAVEAAHGIKD